MTATVWPKEMLEIFDPSYVVPAIGYLTWEGCQETGRLVDSAVGCISLYRYQRTYGHAVSAEHC